MIPLFLLNWAVIAVSLFNTILMLWLGLTILLNTERQTWGVWLTGGGLLVSGAFFVSHTAIFGSSLGSISRELDFWWRFGWLPVIICPFAWYLAMLWYSGFWSKPETVAPERSAMLRRRQRPWLFVTILLAVGLFGLLVFANPLPSYTQVAQLRLSATPMVGQIPLLIWVYPLYILLCILLSLDVLRHPAPSDRMMGDLARRRARPWLLAASVVLLAVSLLVGWIMFWLILNAHQREVSGLYADMTRTVTWFDVIISGLIALVVIFVGRAIVSYEVFTGRILPRRGLFRYWRSVVILAAGYGVIMGWSLTFALRPVYIILLTTILIALFYALFSWRSYAERERYIAHLRPFVASQRLYEHLLTPTTATPSEVDAVTPFRALCADVLGARVAYLAAVGPLAPLVGPTLAYPAPLSQPLPTLTELIGQFNSPQTIGVALEPAHYQGAMWAVPLWSERGLIGVLLLGEKHDGGLYTQEEIEIARASGERLIDTRASAEIARRLMALQRQRLTESQLLDRRARRVLHDDVLPDLHAAMLTLSGKQAAARVNGTSTVSLLAGVHHQIADLLRQMPPTTAPEVAKLGLIGALHHVVDDELAGAFDRVIWQIQPGVRDRLRAIPPLVAEVLFYAAREAIRNAAHHARDVNTTLPLSLTVSVLWEDGLKIIIEDNGVGFGLTTHPTGGSGQGLALHSTMMAVVGGSLAIESEPEGYTRVSLMLPGGG
jgi:signal transduction histidine kinase